MSISSGESVTQTIGEEFPLETRPFKRKGLKGQSLELDKDGILEYIHALEILASSPLSKGSRDFNRGEQSPAPPPPPPLAPTKSTSTTSSFTLSSPRSPCARLYVCMTQAATYTDRFRSTPEISPPLFHLTSRLPFVSPFKFIRYNQII